jgi:hypothetical protein
MFSRTRNLMLYDAMVRAGLNNRALSKASGVCLRSVSRLINRKSLPSMSTATAIANALGCAVMELGWDSFAIDRNPMQRRLAVHVRPALAKLKQHVPAANPNPIPVVVSKPGPKTEPAPKPEPKPASVRPVAPARATQDAIRELQMFLEIARFQTSESGATIAYGPLQKPLLASLSQKGLITTSVDVLGRTTPTISEKGMTFLESLIDTPMPFPTWTKVNR